MIEKIKKNKLKSVCIGLSAFLFGFITVTLFQNINNTYASAADNYTCTTSGYSVVPGTDGKYYCCPSGFEYKNFTYQGTTVSSQCGKYVTVTGTCPSGTTGPGAVGTPYNGYCTVKAQAAYACYKCDVSNSYKWGTSTPSESCSGGSWHILGSIKSAANCKAPTYSCWKCDVDNKYVWASSQPSTTCSGGSWYKSNTITSAANCKAPTTTYTATFYANGGTFSDGSTTWTKKIYSGARNYFSQMGIPTLTLSGCTADGWYMTNASGTVYRQYFDTGDATKFYAHWSCSSSGGETGGGETPTPTTYTVKYDANGGTGAPSNQTKKQGESLTISTVKPTKTGYTFTSWNTKKDGTGTKYDIGALYTVDAELTLYAQYKENTVTYTIKYDANGGENAPKEQTKTKGKELVLSTIVPTKEGYKFVNWNTKKDGTGTSYNAGAKYTTEASVILYAQYEKELNEEETKYTITFYTNDGTTEKSTKVVNKGDKVVKPEDPTREGYTFDGWYDKKENGKEYDFTKEVTSDISLYAYWSKIGDKTNEDVDKNSKTGDILIFIAWTAGIGALTYSVYYFKSRKETI